MIALASPVPSLAGSAVPREGYSTVLSSLRQGLAPSRSVTVLAIRCRKGVGSSSDRRGSTETVKGQHIPRPSSAKTLSVPHHRCRAESSLQATFPAPARARAVRSPDGSTGTFALVRSVFSRCRRGCEQRGAKQGARPLRLRRIGHAPCEPACVSTQTVNGKHILCRSSAIPEPQRKLISRGSHLPRGFPSSCCVTGCAILE